MTYKKTKKQLQKELNIYAEIQNNYGLTFGEIAEKIGVSEPTIRNINKRYNKYGNEFSKIIEAHGFNPDSWNHGWLKVEGASVFIKNKDVNIDWEGLTKEIVDNVKQNSYNYKTIQYKTNDNPVCAVVDISDAHYNKYAHKGKDPEYNIDLASKSFRYVIQQKINHLKNYNVDKIIFVGGNDVLHTDGVNRGTTKGTPQDMSTTFDRAFMKANNDYVWALEQLEQIAPIEYIHTMSNHDYFAGWTLSQVIEAHFNKNNNIKFQNNTNARKYVLYGNHLMMFTHSTKNIKRLKEIIPVEARQLWVKAKNCTIEAGHVHHRYTEDGAGIETKNKRSISPPDKWHDDMAYNNKPASDMEIYSKDGLLAITVTTYIPEKL